MAGKKKATKKTASRPKRAAGDKAGQTSGTKAKQTSGKAGQSSGQALSEEQDVPIIDVSRDSLHFSGQPYLLQGPSMMQVLEAGHCPFRQSCPLAGGRGSPSEDGTLSRWLPSSPLISHITAIWKGTYLEHIPLIFCGGRSIHPDNIGPSIVIIAEICL